MKDDREQVLAQIRASLKTAYLPAARATIPPRTLVGQGNRAVMIENFRRELDPLGGKSYLARSDAEAIEIVLNLLKEVGGKELLMWDESELPVRGLGDALRHSGYTRLDVQLSQAPDARHARLLELERAAAGITGALAGLADTGSLALVSSPMRPRLASLLPPTHIALLQTSRLFETMASFFAAYPEVTRDASNLVFITGPSRSADIELTLTRGVHGPKELHVILLD
ncbi:MAG TPA: lactate utilization protein [Anaerolineae bacterium]|nr:lactate utilization protein [Anaerolineae bacterium]